MGVVRYYFVMGLFGLLAVLLSVKLLSLGSIESEFLQDHGDQRTIRNKAVKAHRGIIFDRFGEQLTKNDTAYDVWINPGDPPDGKDLQLLEESLDLPSGMLLDRIRKRSDRFFIYVKRDVGAEVSERLLKIRRVYQQLQEKRVYAFGRALSHVLGFVDIDGKGQEGLELEYDDWLYGKSGNVKVLVDRKREKIKNLGPVKGLKMGQDLQLSIDLHLQLIALRELSSVINQYEIESGSLVALNPATGEILALVNFPSYDPNDRDNMKVNTLRNRAVVDTYEPGHLVSPFVLLAALESKQFDVNSLIDTSPGHFEVGARKILDIRDYGSIDLGRILSKSSNVGLAKITLSLTETQIYDSFKGAGFGESTSIGFPGESIGVMVDPTTALSDIGSKMEQVALAAGNGLSATPLQMALAYSVLANRGVYNSPSLLKKEKMDTGDRRFNTETTEVVLNMLKITAESEARGAMVPGYVVAGQGSVAATVSAKGGYDETRKNFFFAGIVPVEEPKLVVLVALNNVNTAEDLDYQTATKVFTGFAKSALPGLGVEPSLQN